MGRSASLAWLVRHCNTGSARDPLSRLWRCRRNRDCGEAFLRNAESNKSVACQLEGNTAHPPQKKAPANAGAFLRWIGGVLVLVVSAVLLNLCVRIVENSSHYASA